jgi:hypothetical protein
VPLIQPFTVVQSEFNYYIHNPLIVLKFLCHMIKLLIRNDNPDLRMSGKFGNISEQASRLVHA